MKQGVTPKSERINDEDIFLTRDLSWLDFNSRVLDEAFCPANKLLDRLRFVAIFSSNLDEFFMVRVAALRQLVKHGLDTPDPSGMRPSEQLREIRKRVEKLVDSQYNLLLQELLPALEEHGVYLKGYSELTLAQREEVAGIFHQDILPALTPLGVDPSHPFPMLRNGAIEIAVRLQRSGAVMTGEKFAFVEVPEGLPRYLSLECQATGEQIFVTLEEVIMGHLGELFAGCVIEECFPFRITRDMDFLVDDSGAEDLITRLERQLLERRRREPIRLEIPETVSRESILGSWLENEFHLEQDLRYRVPGLLHLKTLFEFAGKVRKSELSEAVWKPLPWPVDADDDQDIFETIKRNSPILLALPFHSFEPVVRLLEEAADDPQVLAIKQTLYRVSGDSPVVRALRRAAENGKQVTVIVELKARFDESNNISWARKLEESGAHVVYGISGLKIHCKALLIVRREDESIRRYVHLSTGNYNDKTAMQYTDLGYFCCDAGLCREVAGLFNVMTGYATADMEWRDITAAPFSLRTKFLELIDREARLSTPECPGRIIAKINSLSDPEIVRHLYLAALKGVQIDLIVRGICCIKTGPSTPNIRVRSIVDRYLEHSRVYYFGNGGNEEFYLSSADWMTRNLDRRIELLFQISDSNLTKQLTRIIELELADKDKARIMGENGIYSRPMPEKYDSSRSQKATYDYYAGEAARQKAGRANRMLHILTKPAGDN